MPKQPKSLSEEKFNKAMLTFTEHLNHARLDLLVLQTALVDKGVISDADLAKAVEKVVREGKKTLDDLAANPAKVMSALRGKRGDVQ